MPAPVVKVELGADLGARDPNTFLLDDATRGVLDNTSFTLSGDRFFDITDRLVSADTSRGKNQALDRIDAGNLTIVVDNFDRLFDPLYANGFYFGQLIPGKEIRISCNGFPVIYATVDDIDIAYEPGNRSVVSFQATDGLSTLTQNNLPEVSPDVELSGARVERILDLPEVNWPLDKRIIDTGNSLMSDTDISEGTQAIGYLQLIATSEFGEVFVSKDNNFVFRERNSTPNLPDIIFTDEASISGYTVIPFAELGVVYGTEELYNRIVLTNDFPTFPDEVTVEDLASQVLYGPRSYSQTGLLNNEAADLEFLANFLLLRFKEPQYRFNSLSVVMDILSQTQQDQILDLEIGDIVQVRFTPSGIPPAIEQYVRVIGISHDWSNNEKRIELSLERLDFSLFILDDPVLGVLDEDRLTY
jgi:hypothetical protein